MDRRTFVKEGGVRLGVLTLGSSLLFSQACNPNPEVAYNKLFSVDEVRLLNELGEIILPATDTPGAKEAEVGEFIALIVQDCYEERDQIKFKEGLKEIDVQCGKLNGRSFLKCSVDERRNLVAKLEDEPGNYRPIKNLIVSAYLSSEAGATQLLRYNPVPGRYDGCTSDRPW